MLSRFHDGHHLDVGDHLNGRHHDLAYDDQRDEC